MTEGVTTRRERAGDEPAIHDVVRLAFGRDDEADLVDGLRADGAVLSLVAVEADEVVGHVLFCRLRVDTPTGPADALALAPLTVRPDRQRRGIGSRLVRDGLAATRDAGHRIVTVLGDAAYYGRFGFTTAAAKPLIVPFPPEHWMALELAPGALAGVRGRAMYPRPFGLR